METTSVRRAQSESRPDSSGRVEQETGVVRSELWIGLTDLIKRVPIVRSLDLLSGGDKPAEDGKEKLDVSDGPEKAEILAEAETRDEPMAEVDSQGTDYPNVQETGNSVALDNVAMGEENRQALPTVAKSPSMSAEERIKQMKRQLKQLRSSIDWKRTVFMNVKKEYDELVVVMRRLHKKNIKVQEKYKKTMAHLKKIGYILPAAQNLDKPRRRSVSGAGTASSADTFASDVSLVIELRRAASSLYGMRSVDRVSCMELDADCCSFVSAMDSPVVEDSSETASLSSIKSFSTAVSVTDLDGSHATMSPDHTDQHKEHTAQKKVDELPHQHTSLKHKNKLLRLKKWLQH